MTTLPAPAHAMDTRETPTTTATSPYRIVDRDGVRLLMVEGADPSLCMTGMRLNDPSAVFSACSTVMLQWASFMPNAKDVVLVGLGGGEIPKFVHAHLPQARMVAVEIDLAMVDMARRHFGLMPDDERLSVVVGDGVEHVRSLPDDSCDVLILDAYDNDYQVPAALVTEAFSQHCARVLRADGLMSINLLRRTDEWRADYLRMLTGLFARIVQIRLSAEQVVLLAFKNVPQLDWAQVHERAAALEPQARLQLPTFARFLEQCLKGPVLQPAPVPA